MINEIDKKLLKTVANNYTFKGAYNIRKNGKALERKTTSNINIIPKKDVSGIDIKIKPNTKNETVHIPVIITESGVNDVVYNDFYVGENADVTIIAGCGIHNDNRHDSIHNGIHRFFLEKGAKVKYIEKHYGEGDGLGKRILNPVTEVTLKEESMLEMETLQIKGVDSTVRTTKGIVGNNANLVITERILTHGKQKAKTIFDVKLNGKNASTKVASRSVATENSKQEFISKVYGNGECFGHVECDAIVKDKAKITSTPKIIANSVEATLIHEAIIGKIAGEQLIKLMTLGLSKEKAEETIINGFLK